jgi:phytoene synthase
VSELSALEAQVKGSSFYAAMRLMPRPQRAAMFAIYAFCRQVDDIADDGQRPRPARRKALDAWRDDLDRLFAGLPAGQADFLAPAARGFGLAKSDFRAVIDGMETDVVKDVRAPTWIDLDLYCDRVASAVGRLSVRVFGMEEAPGIVLAHHLGRALQLTNILRDLDEDAEIGRLYLPLEALVGAGIFTQDPKAAVANPAVDHACREVAARAHDHYREANAVMAAKPKGRLLAPRLMEAVYSEILRRTEAQGWAPPRRRVKIGKARLAWLALSRGMLG